MLQECLKITVDSKHRKQKLQVFSRICLVYVINKDQLYTRFIRTNSVHNIRTSCESFFEGSLYQMKTIGVFCGLLAVLIVCRAEGNTAVNNSYCVSNYKEFEKKTFANNSHNQHLLYEAFYPPNGHLPYSVKLSYLTVLPNGRVVNISTSDPVCTIVQWRWIASPVFLSFDPHVLNILVFYTLNYFRDWTTPSIALHVPYPCPNVTLHYLTLMTSLVSLIN